MISDYYIPGFQIQNISRAPDDVGGFTTSYQTAGTIYGRICPLSGNEILKNEKINVITTHRFYCGYNTLVTTSSKIVAPDGRAFEVKLIVDPMELHEFLQIDCELKQ